jgi:hypothetical protein
MINYHLNHGDITDFILVSHSEDDEKNVCNLCDCGESLLVHQLLNLDYYPVPVLNNSIQTAAILPLFSELYNFIAQSWKTPFAMPASPPPKQV